MSDDPINLKRERKRRQREAAARRAQARRAWHGATRAERQAQRLERERLARRLEGHRREASEDGARDGEDQDR
jgi:hypothetical protein